MKKQIKCVSLVQNAKVVAALYLVLSLPMLLIMLAIGGATNQAGLSLAVVLTFVVTYVAGGFLMTLFAGWIYNLVAARVGGLEFTTSEVGAG